VVDQVEPLSQGFEPFAALLDATRVDLRVPPEESDRAGNIAGPFFEGHLDGVRPIIEAEHSVPSPGQVIGEHEHIVDLVGYGSTATCFSGTAPAPAPGTSDNGDPDT